MGKGIGIDLGVSKTVVSYVNSKNRIAVLRMNGSTEIPNVLYFRSRDEMDIGKEAAMKAMIHPEAAIRNFTENVRDMKYKYEVHPEDGGKPFKVSVKQAVQYFLARMIFEMQEKIRTMFSEDDDNFIDRAVITIPEKTNPAEYNLIRRAAIDANLEKVALVTEPVAAVLAYMHDNPLQNQNVLVYHYGSGIFEISLIHVKDGVCTVQNADSCRELSGNRLTEALVQLIVNKVNRETGLDMPSSYEEYADSCTELDEQTYTQILNEIHKIAESVKVDMSDWETEHVTYEANLLLRGPDGEKKNFVIPLSEQEIEKYIGKDIDKTISVTGRMLTWGENNQKAADLILLVGGNSQNYLIRRKLEQFGIVISEDADAGMLISRGAAIAASDYFSREQMIHEKTPCEIGIRSHIGAVYDAFYTILDENMPLPCKGSAEFSIVDGERSVSVMLYERDGKRKDSDITIRSNAVSPLETVLIDELPEGEGRSAKITLNMKEDRSMEVIVDIIANGVLISKNHSYQKESNLL